MAPALRTTFFAGLLGIALIASEMLIYQPHVVPRLITWTSIPWDWMLAIFGPALVVFAVVAILARGIVELLSFAFIAALVVESLMWLAFHLKLSGHLSPVEGGPIKLLAHYLLLVALLLGIVGALYLLRMGLRRVRAS